jgi:hypothetical protein
MPVVQTSECDLKTEVGFVMRLENRSKL